MTGNTRPGMTVLSRWRACGVRGHVLSRQLAGLLLICGPLPAWGPRGSRGRPPGSRALPWSCLYRTRPTSLVPTLPRPTVWEGLRMDVFKAAELGRPRIHTQPRAPRPRGLTPWECRRPSRTTRGAGPPVPQAPHRGFSFYVGELRGCHKCLHSLPTLPPKMLFGKAGQAASSKRTRPSHGFCLTFPP